MELIIVTAPTILSIQKMTVSGMSTRVKKNLIEHAQHNNVVKSKADLFTKTVVCSFQIQYVSL